MPRVRRGVDCFNSRQRANFKRKLLEQYGEYCQLCLTWGKGMRVARIIMDSTDQAKSFSIDHIVPLSTGGPNTLDNMWPAHIACNEQRKDTPLTVRVKVDFAARDRSNRRRKVKKFNSPRLAYSSSSDKFLVSA